MRSFPWSDFVCLYLYRCLARSYWLSLSLFFLVSALVFVFALLLLLLLLLLTYCCCFFCFFFFFFFFFFFLVFFLVSVSDLIFVLLLAAGKWYRIRCQVPGWLLLSGGQPAANGRLLTFKAAGIIN